MCYHHFYHYQNHCCLAVKVGEAGPAWSTQSQAAPRVLCGLRSHRQPRAWCVVYAVTGSPTCGAWSTQSQAAPWVELAVPALGTAPPFPTLGSWGPEQDPRAPHPNTPSPPQAPRPTWIPSQTSSFRSLPDTSDNLFVFLL